MDNGEKSEKDKYLSAEEHFRDMVRGGKRRWEDGRKALQAIIDQRDAPRPPLEGSDVVITQAVCLEFYQKFAGLTSLTLQDLGPAPEAREGYWTLSLPKAWTYIALVRALARSMVSLTYPELLTFLTDKIDEEKDTRRAKDGPYTLQTPAGRNAQQANPTFINLSYRQIRGRQDVLTALEATTLTTIFRWKASEWLDPGTFTRTSSRVDGDGVVVYGSIRGLHVGCERPDSFGGDGAAREAIVVKG